MKTVEHTVRVDLLGPLDLTVDGRAVPVRGPKRRALLALLALSEGLTANTTELVDLLWPTDPPGRVEGALQSHVSRLRAHLGPAAERLVATEHGYRLRLDAGELDVDVARRGLDRARRVAPEDPSGAADQLTEVRRLWRGRALAEFDRFEALAARGVALTDLCQQVDSLLVGCALRAGDLDRALAASAAAVADHPSAEEPARLRMEALARAGRVPEALRVGSELRRRLRDDLGLEASIELVELERAIASGSVAPGPTAGLEASTDVGRPQAVGDGVPHSATPLVGRESEVVAVARLLSTDRLVGVVGPGGVGKTRLAADVARRHEGETHWVSLASLDDPDGLPRLLGDALGLQAARGDVLGACTRLLGAGPCLLVLDNCEHVHDGVRAVVARLLRDCPELTVLVTSRQRLGLADESSFRLAPLAVPDPASPTPEQAPALALFLDRARRVHPGSELDADEVRAAVTVVRRLDGVPLAIELAAGRLSSLDVVSLRDRLDRALDLLGEGGSGEARHRTLRATLAWSYDLLPADRRRLLRHLAVFPDGVDLATAEQLAGEVGVAGDPAAALGHLVDASMLDAGRDGTPRYRMLDTLRSFGLEQLEANGEAEAAERRFLRWAEDLVRWVEATMYTPDERIADSRLRRELANLRAAWNLALRRGALDTAVEIVVGLDDAAQWRELPEVWTWARALVDDPRLLDHPRRAAALATAADFAWLQGDLDGASALAETALACASDDDGSSRSLVAVAVARLSHGDFLAVRDLATEASALTPHPEHSLMLAALAMAYHGDLDAARGCLDAVPRPSGITQRGELEYATAEVASIAGRYDDAERHYRRAIELASEVGSSFVVGIAEVGLFTVLRRTGRHREALEGYRQVLAYWQEAGNGIQVWTTLRNLAALLFDLGDTDTAAALLAAADRAPDAPAVGVPDPSEPSLVEATAAPPDRAAAVTAAMEAVERALHARPRRDGR